MRSRTLTDKRVAILAADGVEEIELTDPRRALNEAGAQTHLVAPNKGQIQAWQNDRPAGTHLVDVALDEARADNYDALLLPGGALNADRLRQNERAVAFVKSFVQSARPIAAICHGPCLLIEADGVRGRTVTSSLSLRTDLTNANADWVDRDVATDEGLVTSRSAADIAAFNVRMIEAFAASPSAERAQSARAARSPEATA